MKRTQEDFELDEARGLSALEERRAAERAIVAAAVLLEAEPPGLMRLELWRPFMDAVKRYNQAEADIRAAQQALDERARTR